MITARGDAIIAKLRMALAEMGFGDVDLVEQGTRGNGLPNVVTPDWNIPAAVWWQACYLAYEGAMPCWACWDSGVGVECGKGNCAHPEGPSRPPRELLVRPWIHCTEEES